MADWDARTYERVSDPQLAWGKRVLERLPLQGDETVIDAGCGAGRLTELLADRVPRGHVVAFDASPAMLERARERLARFGDRITFVHADAATYVHRPPADAVFSTATFHWVPDHDSLFRSLRASLREGGRLVAQWGGAGNLQRIRSRAARLRSSGELSRFFEGFREPWLYATPEETAERMRRAGFADVKTWLEPTPTPFDGAERFREFVASVVLRDDLAHLPDDGTRTGYMDAIVEQSAKDEPPFELDYIRLNADARIPER
jgi:trans-aconitate methyltransferase